MPVHPFFKQMTDALPIEEEQLFPTQAEEDAFQLWANELLPVEEENFINHVAPVVPPSTPPGYYSPTYYYNYNLLDLSATDDEDSNEKRPSLKRIYNEIE